MKLIIKQLQHLSSPVEYPILGLSDFGFKKRLLDSLFGELKDWDLSLLINTK